MADDKTKKPAAEKPTGKIVVRGPEGGRWRAGRHFTRDAATIDLADLSADEIADIEGDPVLSASRVA